MATNETTALRKQLEAFGRPGEVSLWVSRETDYVARLGVTPADVPELLAIAREWATETEWPDDKDWVAGFAPIHAWRTVAQLQAAEAIGPLLDMLDPLDKSEDDWFVEEFPPVFASIGTESIEPLIVFLCDENHEHYARCCAGSSLVEIAKAFPEARKRVVNALCDAMLPADTSDSELNGSIIAHLLDLHASEAAERIEPVFAADNVDVAMCGNWNDVRKELGVPGLGLVSEEIAGQTWIWSRDFPEPEVTKQDIPAPRQSEKIGRNEPCPCGSGKKYKKCCGK